jgi:oxygen-independent coproporphyrinogen-3 oxidase
LAHGDREPLGEKTLAGDAVVFGLRMNRGIDLDAIGKRFPTVDLSPLDELFGRLVADGYLCQSAGRLRPTTHGQLVADAIAVEILETL